MESDDFLCRDEKGNLLLAVEPIEEDALAKDPHFTHCLAVVKVGDEHLLGWNNWRKRFELFGGCREEGETPRVCILRECREELDFQGGEIQYLGAMKLRLIADYFPMRPEPNPAGSMGLPCPPPQSRRFPPEYKTGRRLPGWAFTAKSRAKNQLPRLTRNCWNFSHNIERRLPDLWQAALFLLCPRYPPPPSAPAARGRPSPPDTLPVLRRCQSRCPQSWNGSTPGLLSAPRWRGRPAG